jgi:A/G-specific adenine glycosylase
MLPFRGVTDPYLILVSEVMAQQTQIARVGEAWRVFTGRFPSVRALAAADQADVIRAWRGLGYNRRAINLWRAARAIVDEHDGELPRTVDGLEALPGVGPYTARAVAAIAFGAPVGAVDTNVRRVLARATTGSIDGLAGRALQMLADASVPPARPSDWTHAVMDVGATFCRTTGPVCAPCPASAWCRYAARDGVDEVGRVQAPRARVHFPATARWLRGRILDRLRDGEPGTWLAVDAPIGAHDAAAVSLSLAALAGDGLAEVHPGVPLTARLPIG